MGIAPRAAALIAAACASLCGCAGSASTSSPPLPGDAVARDVSVLRGTFVAGAPAGRQHGAVARARGLDRRRQRPPCGARAADRRCRARERAAGRRHRQYALASRPRRRQRAAARGVPAARRSMPARRSTMRWPDSCPTTAYSSSTDRARAGGQRRRRSAGATELARIDAGPRLYPTPSVTGAGTRTIAGRRLQLGLERNAVSGGDVWLLDPYRARAGRRRPGDAAGAAVRHRLCPKVGARRWRASTASLSTCWCRATAHR